ncbi:MAG: hypothetical protein Q9224_003769 [Gallowayella concinna]
MLSDISLELAYRLQTIKDSRSFDSHPGTYLGILFLGSCYFIWRLWTFTIRPYLWPQAPKQVPYWVPSPSSDYTRRSHEIFSVTVWGEKMYIVTASDDVARALKNTHALVFHDYLIQLLINFGVGKKTRRLLWYEAKPDDPLYLPDDLVTPRQKSVSYLTEEVYRQQLLPGEKMDSMCKVFMDSVKDTLQWHRLDFCTRATFPDSRRKQISLNALCRYTMVDAATRSMFGAYLHKFEPDIVEHILGLNDSIWMIIFRYPNAFASAVNAPRSKIMDAMKKFISLPEEQRSEQSWSVKTVLQAQDHVGIDLENQASILLILLWA